MQNPGRRIVLSLLAIAATAAAQAAFVPGSLVAYWPMDEADNTVKTLDDASGNGNNGVFTEGPAVLGFELGTGGSFTTTGPTINTVTSNAYEFDGNDDLLTVPDSVDFDTISNQGSISFWVNADADARMSILRGRNTGDDSYTGPALEKTGSSGGGAYRVFFNPNVAEAAYFMAEALPTANVWQHYVFTWDYTQPDSGDAANPNRIKCYVNGVQTLNRTATGGSGDAGFTVPPTFGELVFGGRFDLADANAGTYRAFDGEMAEIAIYSSTLSSGDAATLFSTGVNPAAPSLVGYWNFSEGSGATTDDLSANSNVMNIANWEPALVPATVANGPVYSAANAGAPTYISRALTFDGGSDAVQVPDSASLDFTKDQGTVSYWAYFDSNARTGVIGDTSGSFVNQISSSTRMALAVPGSTDFVQTTAAGTTVPTGEWVHYAYVFDQTQPVGTTADPNRIKIYRNGVALTNAVANLDSTWTTAGTTADWIIGRRQVITDVGNARWLGGQLAEMAIFNTPLSQSDIQDIIDNGVADFLPAAASPTIDTNSTLNVGRSLTTVIGSANLSASDATEGPAALTYTVTAIPAQGTLSATTFTQLDINNGTVTYTSPVDLGGVSFDFSLSDGTVAAPVLGTFSINVVATLDTDRDGIPDDVEIALGTMVDNKDSDSDGIEDGVEVAIGTNPLLLGDPADTTDSDGDLIPDAYETGNGFTVGQSDQDGDKVLDGYEFAVNGSPSLAGTPSLGETNQTPPVNNSDAIRILSIFLGNEGKLVIDERMDINRDGSVDNVDAVILFQWALGNIPHIPFP